MKKWSNGTPGAIWEGLGWSIRRLTNDFLSDLVLLDIRKPIFQKIRHFLVLEMGLILFLSPSSTKPFLLSIFKFPINISRNTFPNSENWKPKNSQFWNLQRRAPEHNWDLSSQTLLNFRGVLFGDKSDLHVFQTTLQIAKNKINNILQPQPTPTHGNSRW